MNRLSYMLRAAVPLAVAAGLAATPAFAQSSQPKESETNGIIITLDASASLELQSRNADDGIGLLADSEIARDLAAAGIDIENAHTDSDDTVLLTAQPTDGQSDAQALADAQELEGVADVQYNYVYHLIESEEAPAPSANGAQGGISTLATLPVNDEFTARSSYRESRNQYWAYNANLIDAWSDANDSSSVTVAVLDSGVLLDHEDLKDNVLADLAYDVVADEPLSEAEVQDCAGHGTNVAGVIAARANNRIGLAGASLNAKILPVKVVRTEDAYIDSDYLISAYDYLFELMEADKLADLRVINMSVGGYGNTANDEAFHQRIKDMLYKHDVITVCAGGNKGTDKDKDTPGTDPIFPSDFEECVSVTALEPDGTNIVGFDYNDAKDISAPGNYIWSTYHTQGNTSTNEYRSQRGSSEASPIVAGTIALMCAAEPDATPEQIIEALYNTATPVDNSSLEANGSHGALDADAALDYLQDHMADDPKPEPEPEPEPEPDPEPTPLPFTDVNPGDWYYDPISFVYENKIMKGYDGSTKFGPNDELRREQLAQLLYQYMGNGEVVAEAAPQLDVDQSQYYAAAVNWAVKYGIIGGYTEADGSSIRFGVGDVLTREQLAVVIARLSGQDIASADATKFNALPDNILTHSWARSSMVWAVDRGIISGRESNGTRMLDPRGVCTRAEVAQIVTNCVKSDIL